MSSYEAMKKFFEVYTSKFLDLSGIPSQDMPLEALKKLEERGGRVAQKGLKDAINDLLTMSMNLPPKEVEEIERELQVQGAPSLADMRFNYLKKYHSIIKRGNIINMNEYYLIKNIVSSVEISSGDQVDLYKMLDNFEMKNL